MKTAEEKREVAENLREQAAYPGNSSMYMEAFIEDLKQIIDTYGMSNNYADLYDILADLIEPEPERTCHNKIADINRLTPFEYRTDNFLCSACGEQFFADSEYINHPIDWAFCPNCGAKVVEE